MPSALCAQEDRESIAAATTYLESRSASLSKYIKRSDRIQQRLLKELKCKEEKFARQIARKDSAAYRDYLEKKLTYDSIAKLSRDTAQILTQTSGRTPLIDSLKGIQMFIGDKTAKLNSIGGSNHLPENSYTKKLSSLQQQLNVQEQVKQQLQHRTKVLEDIAEGKNLPGLKSIQKKVYYAQEKMKAWTKVANQPEAAEEEALEFLQGTDGFSDYLKTKNIAYSGLPANANAADLQNRGYQTRQSVSGILQQKLGNNLGAVQQQMAEQVKQYSEMVGSVTNKVSEVNEKLNSTKQTLAEAKQAKENLKNIEKPAFRRNPERGKPFWHRLEPQLSFQTSRASSGGSRPAMLEMSFSLGFKHTPKLSYGLGGGLSAGLGRNWQNVKFTYEGISVRAYMDLLLQYGVSVQGGCERIFRPADRAYLPEVVEKPEPTPPTNHSNTLNSVFGGQQQSIYLGLMKRYRISSRYNGTIMVGYNFLFKQEGLNTPFMLRLGWGK